MGKAHSKQKESRWQREYTAESKKTIIAKTRVTQKHRQDRQRQQRAKRDNHGFVLILCNNAILFRYFPPTVQLASCFVLSWLKYNARLQYPLVHKTPCPVGKAYIFLHQDCVREQIPCLASTHNQVRGLRSNNVAKGMEKLQSRSRKIGPTYNDRI